MLIYELNAAVDTSGMKGRREGFDVLLLANDKYRCLQGSPCYISSSAYIQNQSLDIIEFKILRLKVKTWCSYYTWHLNGGPFGFSQLLEPP